MSPLDSDRRASPRLPYRFTASVALGTRQLWAQGVDINHTGLGLILPCYVLPGAYVRLNITLSDLGIERPFDVDGLITHSEAYVADSKVGVQFTVVDGEVLEWISRNTAPAANRRQHGDVTAEHDAAATQSTGVYGFVQRTGVYGVPIKGTFGVSGRPMPSSTQGRNLRAVEDRPRSPISRRTTLITRVIKPEAGDR